MCTAALTCRVSIWTFSFCLLWFWTPVGGLLQLIGPPEPIIAAPGDDVVLPCRVDSEWDAVGKTVEWSRPDMRVAGSTMEYVFVYRFRRTDRDMMMETYVQRTSLSDEGLRRGDVSLRIRNVSVEDDGRFRCFIPRLKIEAEVRLVVDPEFGKTTTTETVPDRNLISLSPQEENISDGRRSKLPLCCIMVFFIISLIGLFVSCFKKCSKNTEYKNKLFSKALSGCLAQEHFCVDVDGSSTKSQILISESSNSAEQLSSILTLEKSSHDQSEAYR